MDFNVLIQGSPYPVLNGDGLALFRIVKPLTSRDVPTSYVRSAQALLQVMTLEKIYGLATCFEKAKKLM